jgi:hypothetical protein
LNLKYLGDALDHWKGSLFEYLANAGVLREFAVDPMASDLPEWTEADYSLFARLLRVDESRIIRHHVTLRDRPRYFAEITHTGDLFLDPDTGIATGRVTKRHISPLEVASLLEKPKDRLLVIYQHNARGMKTSARVDECLAGLGKGVGRIRWCSYESGTVAMLFLSKKVDRTRKVEEALKALLGRHADQRVRGEVCGA